ncbi:MAG: response regulator [Acidimicrobiia bacterium]|nr:response regulator [Acidimicrobiia bacterium]
MPITVFLADDNLIVREGVKALLELEDDFDVVGQGADYDELVAGAEATGAQVVVTDIRMPPNFSREGIEAAKEVRKRHPGTGIVILSQFDDPDYAVSLLSEGAAGYAYLLKDRVGEGDQLARAVREVATGGSLLDSKIVEGLVNPVRADGSLSGGEEELLRLVAEGRSVKAIASHFETTAAAANSAIEALFAKLAEGLAAGRSDSLDRLKMLQRAIVESKEQGEALGRLLPGGVAAQIIREGRRPGETEELIVTVLMSDIRGYTTIAEHAEPSVLAGQLHEHRAAMNRAILGESGTVMQFVGDAVMAVFGAPVAQADHAERAVAAATAMHDAQAELNERWEADGLSPFGLGIGLSTGLVAAALLGSEERLEYSVVGDTVNLTQRLQQWAEPGETVLSEPTWNAIEPKPDADTLEPAMVKGRDTAVGAYRFPPRQP